MSSPIVIDRKTYKVMRYLYFHDDVSIAKIKKKYKTKGFMSLVYLSGSPYIAHSKESGKFTYGVDKDASSGIVSLTIQGRFYVESRIYHFFQWFVPTLISLVALLISALALFAGFNNELFVHLLK